MSALRFLLCILKYVISAHCQLHRGFTKTFLAPFLYNVKKWESQGPKISFPEVAACSHIFLISSIIYFGIYLLFSDKSSAAYISIWQNGTIPTTAYVGLLRGNLTWDAYVGILRGTHTKMM